MYTGPAQHSLTVTSLTVVTVSVTIAVGVAVGDQPLQLGTNPNCGRLQLGLVVWKISVSLLKLLIVDLTNRGSIVVAALMTDC